MISVLLTGLYLGITSNIHCIGMCGPLSAVVPVNRKNKWTILWGIVVYNLGRIATYSILGGIVGSIGITLNVLISTQITSILFGSLMLLIAWSPNLRNVAESNFITGRIGSFVSSQFPKVQQKNASLKPLLFGFLNGLLPCGLVYIGLFYAMSTGTTINGMLSMLSFGVGTLPVMMVMSFFMQSMNRKFSGGLSKLLPYFLTLAAVLTILRGMNLGIPVLSPKIELNSHGQPSIECCKSTKRIELNP